MKSIKGIAAMTAEIDRIDRIWEDALAAATLENLEQAEKVKALIEALKQIDDDPPIGMDWDWHREIARRALTAFEEEDDAG